MSDREKWGQVGEMVTAALREQAMSQADLVRASGVSDFTVRRVMRGEPGNYRPDRLAKIAVALGWTPDSIHRILNGQGPSVDEGRWKLAHTDLVGPLLREHVGSRREQLHLSIEDAAAAAEITAHAWRQIEAGKSGGTETSRFGVSRALNWTWDSMDRIISGRPPVPFDDGEHPIKLSASGVDLDELAEKDPEAYEAIMLQARIALNRARERTR